MYERIEDETVQAFYKLYADWMEETPDEIVRFVEELAKTSRLERRGDDYPVDRDCLRRASESLVQAAEDMFSFKLGLAADDPSQLDRLMDNHLIDPAVRPYFANGRVAELDEQIQGQYEEANEQLRVPNEPLLYYCLGAFRGEWQVRHRQAQWALYAPLNPIQSFPDMISAGTTICTHPFSQVCKKMTDPEGDNLAYKVHVAGHQKRYLPPFPLLASLSDVDHAVIEMLPEPARRGLAAEEAEQDEQAWELFCEGAMQDEQPQLLGRMIACAWRLEKYDMVDGVSQRLLEVVPDHPLTCHNLAVLYSNQPDLMSEAIELLERAISSDPGYGRARITLASCLAETGKPAQAREQAQWVIDNDPELKDEAEELLESFD